MHYFTCSCCNLKQTVVFILLFFCFNRPALAQTWEPIGADPRKEVDFYRLEVTDLFYLTDTIFAIEKDGAPALTSLLVKKYNGTNWDTVGSAFATGYTAFDPHPRNAVLTLSKDKIPYVAYSDVSAQVTGGYPASVQRYINGTWTPVGNTAFTTNAVVIRSIVIDSAGTPFVAFTNVNDNKPTVMKYDGTAWGVVGTPSFTTSGASYVTMKLDRTGIPYVAFRDNWNMNKASVVKLSGNSWVTVGMPGISAPGVEMIDLAFDTSGYPIIAYRDVAVSNKATVMKFNGSTWTLVGTQGFTATDVTSLDLTTDTTGTPYVLVSINNFSIRQRVMKFDGSNWVYIGGTIGTIVSQRGALTILPDGQPITANPWITQKYNGSSWEYIGEYGYAPSTVGMAKVAVTSDSVPYAAFKDHAHGGKLTVMNFTGGSWNFVGFPGSSASVVSDVCITTGKEDTVFVAYRDSLSGKAVVVKFDGTDWVELGSSANNPSPGACNDLALAIDTSGVPILAFVDATAFNAPHVRRYENGVWTSVGGGVVAGPAANTLNLKIGSDNTPYLASSHYVMKLVNGTWTLIGPANSIGTGSKSGFALGADDTPYIAYIALVPYTSLSMIHRALVKKFDGTNWIFVGPSSGTIDHANYVSLTMDADTPYIAVRSGLVAGNTLSIFKWQGVWSGLNWPDNVNTNGVELLTANGKVYVAQDLNFAYLWGYTPATITLTNPVIPPSVLPVIYCQNEPASPLTANGFNLLWYTSLTGTGSPVAPTPSTTIPGMYKWYVTQTWNGIESAKDSITVTVHPAAPVPIIALNGLTLSTTLTGVLYQWFKDGQPLAQAGLPTYTVSQDGIYHLQIEDMNGCKGVSDTISVAGLAVGHIDPNNSLRLYPNPNNGSFNILGNLNVASTNADVIIRDLFGKTVHTETVAVRNGEFEYQVHLGTKATGLFIIHITVDGKTRSIPFVKQ